MDKVMPSPLRYTGSKSWLFQELLNYVPSKPCVVVSPFLGGGSLEFNLAIRGFHVYSYDAYKPVANFWKQFLVNSSEIVTTADFILKSSNSEYLSKLDKTAWLNIDGLQGAIWYYIFNHLVYNGCTGARHRIEPYKARDDGVLVKIRSHNRKVFPFIDYWQQMPKNLFQVECLDFKKSLEKHPKAFLYLDPPYPNRENFYMDGKQPFDHCQLANIIRNRDNWVLSYSDHPLVHNLYSDFTKIYVERKTSCKGTELLIFSHDIAEMIPYQPSQLMLW